MTPHAPENTQDQRADLATIASWIPRNSRVLDLGCGNGELLAYLNIAKHVRGYGLEINPDNVIASIQAGVNVLQGDLNAGLAQFSDHSFDYVVMTSAIQQVDNPSTMVEEMLRVGREIIVTFPNFANWRMLAHLGLQGRMPNSRALPNPWYSTPNIHLCTVKDFEQLCAAQNIHIVRRHFMDHAFRTNRAIRLIPNLFSEIALYQLKNRTR